MGRSTVREDAILEDVQDFTHAILAFIDETGYPLNVATEFETDAAADAIRLKPPAVGPQPAEGSEVNVTFSHIRPYPGVGYDQRRYVSLWGDVRHDGEWLVVRPNRSHGWDEDRLHFFELCERSVPVGHAYMRRLSAERGEEVKPQLGLGWLIFLATRVPFLTATIVPILLGGMIARSRGESNWWLWLLCLIGGSAIHLGLNVLNDVADTTSGADTANVNPTMFSGGSRMIQYGLVSLNAMRATSFALYAVGTAIGLFLVATRGIELLWIGLAGVFLSIAYTAPPFRLVYRGVGEICVALGFGPIMVLGTYFVIAQELTFEAFYASLPVAILIMLVLYVNQIPDKPSDAKTGKNTIVVRLSKEKIVAGYDLSMVATYVLIVAGAITGIMPVWTLLGIVTVPFAVKVHKGLASHYEHPYELMAAMGTNIMVHLATGLLLSAGYLIDILLT
jgi:1,4-dihydroxy-2-naphthoate octaprenyltransferase